MGYNTAGEYRVNLPDGRIQIVSYSAGPHGYIADVKYEGEPVYPEQKPRVYHTPIALTPKVYHNPNTYKHIFIPAPKALQSPIYHQTAPVEEAPTAIEDEAFEAAKEAPAADLYKPRTKYTYKTIKKFLKKGSAHNEKIYR